MKRNLFFPIALALAVALHSPSAAADNAEQPSHSLSPNSPPLLVFRLSYAPLAADLLSTRQVDALGLDDRDYSGEIPGVGVRLASLRGFLDALAEEGAEYFWYCLAQQGSSLASQTGAMGWEGGLSVEKDDPAGTAAWLEKAGLSTRQRLVEIATLNEHRRRMTISRDEKARRELLEGPDRSDPWRSGLRRFLERDYAGIWLNPRPLLGVASLFTGIDFRTAMGAYRLSIPTSIQLDLFDTDGDLGVSLLVENVLSEEYRFDRADASVVRQRKDALAEVTIAPPPGLRKVATASPHLIRALSGMNIDIAPLAPQSVNIALWRDEDGELRWSAACLMPKAADFRKQFQRVLYLLERLSSVAPSPLSMYAAESPHGDALTRLEADGISVTMGLVEMETREGSHAVLLLSGREKDWPNPLDLEVSVEKSAPLLAWRIKPDAHMRGLALSSLLSLAKDRGLPVSEAQLDALLPDEDNGEVAADGADIELISRHGLTPLLLPLAGDVWSCLRRPDGDAGMRLAAERLRFLLDVISQSRFRRLDAKGMPEERLPDSLSQLALNDPETRRWMDSLFGAFRGDYRPTSAVLEEIASGKALNGVGYRITLDGQVWYLTAETRSGPFLRIDYRGRISRRGKEGWEEYRESRFNWHCLEKLSWSAAGF